MDIPLDEQILNALELFHYANKFRNTLFAVIVENSDALRSLLPDLRVLHAANIRAIIFSRANSTLERHLKRWGKRGHKFAYLTSPLLAFNERAIVSASQTIENGEIPVVAFEDSETISFHPCAFYDSALNASALLSARKVLFPGPFPGLLVNKVCQSHPSPSELREFISGNEPLNLDRDFIAYIKAKQEELGFDIILLQKKAGVLFQEVFTHRGAGTLITQDYPNIFRQAAPSDVADIALLMKPYIKAGTILPVREAEIFDDLKDYYVYTVNGQVVASAKLTPYGESAEIGKICTLPRYQRKGRARAITEKILEVARAKRFSSVFSLSTQDRMFVFFRQLGFTEVPREDLPEAWRRNYDFSRPSRAFRIGLK